MSKVISLQKAKIIVQQLRQNGKKIVFTNGCFDIVHLGHLKLLQKCKELGIVILGLNSDHSIKSIKGETRPINDIKYRIEFLSCLEYVDYIIIFDEDTPINLINIIAPDYLIKGGDYKIEEIVGREYVMSYGGRVLTFDFNIKQSTTNIIKNTFIENQYEKMIMARKKIYEEIFKDVSFRKSIMSALNILKTTFLKNGKAIIAGNGGSAEQANHFATELLGHFKNTTKRLPAISISSNAPLITALANDFSFDDIFKINVSTIAQQDDCLVFLSTSGNSINIKNAIYEANKYGIKTILLSSINVNSEIENQCDCVIKVCSKETDIIQEVHLFIIHYLSEILKNE